MALCRSALFILLAWLAAALAHAQAPAPPQPSIQLQGVPVPLYRGSYALVIGVSEYRNPAWPRLPNTVQDAKKVAATLSTQGFVVSLVTDPTADALSKALAAFFARHGRDPDNRLVLFYSGHGHSIGNAGFLVPVDAPDPKADATAFLEMALPMSRIAAESLDYKARHILFVFDSCFSGAIFSTRNAPAAGSLDQGDLALYFTSTAAKPVRYFITAGDENQVVPEISQFTPAFINALEGSIEEINREGYISARDIGAWLTRKLKIYTGPRQTPRNGTLFDARFDQGDMVFQVKNWRRKPAPAPARPTATVPLACAHCPATVSLPGGPLIIGSAANFAGSRSRPSTDIMLHPFEMARTKVTVEQFRTFVRATGYASKARCGKDRNWEQPGIRQEPDHPVVCVSHEDALAYASWLNQQPGSGGGYRLPSSAEWEYAAKGRDRSIVDNVRPYSKQQICQYENVLDRTAQKVLNWGIGFPCEDGYAHTSPVGAFQANTWGLYDISGNVSELLADCYAPNNTLPKDGEPYAHPQCRYYLVAGFSYETDTYMARTALRYHVLISDATHDTGFRLVRR